MKQLIITLFIAAAALSVKAQAPQQPQPEKSVMVLLPVATVKAVIDRTISLIANSNTAWKDANPVIADLQQINILMVAIKPDTTIKVKPTTKNK